MKKCGIRLIRTTTTVDCAVYSGFKTATVPSKYGFTSDANEKAFTLLTATDEPELSYELEKYSL